MHYAHYALWQDEMHQLLDLDDPRPILIWGNHEVGKRTILWEVLQEKQWNNGVLHIKLTQDNNFAKEEERSALAVLRDEEVVRGLRGTRTRMERKPIIILEVPRGHGALMTRLPKCWGWSVLQRQPWLLMQTVVSADSSFHH